MLAICLSAEASATQEIQVQITSGDAPPIVLTNPTESVSFGTLTINGWTIESGAYLLNDGNGSGGFNGISGSIDGLPTCTEILDCTSLICTANPCTADPLKIEISATGFTLPVVGFELSACCQDIPAGITRNLASFWSSSDELDMTTAPLVSFTFTGPLDYGSTGAVGNGRAGPSSYSLTVVDTVTADSTGLSLGTTGFFLSPVLHVSEPLPLLLFGGGLLLLGIAHCKRQTEIDRLSGCARRSDV